MLARRPRMGANSQTAKEACKNIMALLKPTINTRPKDAAFVMMPARIIDSIYVTAKRGSK